MMHWDVMRCSAMQMYETTMLSNFLIHWFITNPLIIQEYLMKGNGPGRPVWYTPASVQQPNPSWVTYPISEWARHPRLSLAGQHSATQSKNTTWKGMGQAAPSGTLRQVSSNPTLHGSLIQYPNGPGIPVWVWPVSTQQPIPHPGQAHPCITQVNQMYITLGGRIPVSPSSISTT